MYLFPNLSILKAFGLSIFSSAVTVGYIVHDNNTNINHPTKNVNTTQPQHQPDKQIIMGWWTQQ